MTDHMNPLPPAVTQQPRPLSPMNIANPGPPPPKRPRLTTDFSSQNSIPTYGPPFGSPGMGTYTHPLPPSPYSSFNTPQPIQPSSAIESSFAQPRTAPGNMGPPEKPKSERATDINDLSDLVFAAGVDLKAEESYLTAVYKNQRASQAATSFGNSFHTSQGSSQTLTPESSFAQWSQSPTAAQLPIAARPSGPLSQPSVKPEDLEQTLKDRHQAAARTQAQARTKHLNNPFLQANAVREKMHQRTYESQVRLRQDGFQETRPEVFVIKGSAMKTPDGSALVAAKIATVTQSSALADLLSLISLATQERLRSVLEDTYATARSRVYGSGGVVPPEWADIATGASKPEQTTVHPESITGTAWDAPPDSAVSPMTVVPLKRAHDDVARPPRPPTPPPEPELAPQPTIRFPSRVPSLLLDLGNSELDQERKRLEARKRRQAAKEKKEQEASIATPDENIESPAAVGTPTSAKDVAAPTELKISKKERERQAKANQTEEVLRQQANQTAALALGGFGSSKKYSWLTSRNSNAGSSLATGAGQRERLANQATGVKKQAPAKSVAPTEDPGLVSKKTYQQLGLWTEAPGLELRDIVNVLERDVKEKRALLRGYQRLANEK